MGNKAARSDRGGQGSKRSSNDAGFGLDEDIAARTGALGRSGNHKVRVPGILTRTLHSSRGGGGDMISTVTDSWLPVLLRGRSWLQRPLGVFDGDRPNDLLEPAVLLPS
ncbi:hypothetical protein GCM10011320_59150 [Neoroseomonas lacus]|uniref:Uncharacterized protein n=1 Tax=Neoroseomonas lacus TaxID=287609 RepID=A0A917L5Z8_9PROT|nr:hypothetical protein GCM10011320_59150 [Neoroseomonas lacus]